MTRTLLGPDEPGPAIPIRLVSPDGRDALLASLDENARRWADTNDFRAAAGAVLVVPDAAGRPGTVLFGLGDRSDDPSAAMLFGKLAGALPSGTYRFAERPTRPELAALAFALGSYRFDRYKEMPLPGARLVVDRDIDLAAVRLAAEAVGLVRDLVNTPANDLGPAELEMAIRTLAEAHGAAVRSVVGSALIAENFPLVHAVGAASDREPRLVDMTWGRPDAPKVTLVGKGVCYDTGGLDIKPSSAMALMKKDMGGAANVIGLADMIMGARLDVRLRVIVPAVENSVSGRAFRTGDVYRSRKGLTVEIGNTDAEGRLILADALALADEEAPDLLVDMATLTGAARIALGPDLPPFFTPDEDLAAEIGAAAEAVADPLWRLPLWRPYADLLDSKIADINHISSGSFAGSITAALFLEKFVAKAKSWVHFDIFAWTPTARPGRPEGGEAQGIRALFSLIRERYPSRQA